MAVLILVPTVIIVTTDPDRSQESKVGYTGESACLFRG
jgi:hypothetical protein